MSDPLWVLTVYTEWLSYGMALLAVLGLAAG